MQVRHYELFLDESGNFTDGRPSLIGGVFCSSGQLTEELALQLLGKALARMGRLLKADRCTAQSCLRMCLPP